MGTVSYKLANDLDNAWINFELDLPLKPSRDGSPNPFYINRPGDTLSRLYNELLSPFHTPPKLFISGQRGTGKSTELQHILSNTDIQKKFWTVNFSIREETDIVDIDYQDLLLAIGSRLYREYKKKGGKLPSKLLDELDSWRGEVEVEILKAQGKIVESEISAGIDAFFANAGVKMKIEPNTRKTIRQILKPRTQELIAIINEISAAIYSHEQRLPLIIIDDLDKPSLEHIKHIFGKYLDILLSPNCAIIYVVSQALFYSNDFDTIRDRSYTLSVIKLLQEKGSEKICKSGYQMLEAMVLKRMNRTLITEEALDKAIRYSGGVVRELVRLVRTAIGRSRRAKSNSVSVDDISWAIAEIRNEYRRILDRDDVIELTNIKTGKFRWSEEVQSLLQMLAVLEYVDDDGLVWHDIHPALNKILFGDVQTSDNFFSADLDQDLKINQDENQTLQRIEQKNILNELLPDNLPPEVRAEEKNNKDSLYFPIKGVKPIYPEDSEQDSKQDLGETIQLENDLKVKSKANEKNLLDGKTKNNGNTNAWVALGDMYFKAGDYDEAITAYNKAIQFDMKNAWAYSNLGLAYSMLGRFTEASLLYQRSIELTKNNSDKVISWNRLGNVYRKMNDYDSAVTAFQKADELEHLEESEE